MTLYPLPSSRKQFTRDDIERFIEFVGFKTDSYLTISILRQGPYKEDDVCIECRSPGDVLMFRRDYIKSWPVTRNINIDEMLEYANSLVVKLCQETIRNADI